MVIVSALWIAGERLAQTQWLVETFRLSQGILTALTLLALFVVVRSSLKATAGHAELSERLSALENTTGVQIRRESGPRFRTAIAPEPNTTALIPQAATLTLQAFPPTVVVTNNPGPEFLCYVGRTLPAITEEDLALNRYGVHLFVFNGNPFPVRLRVQSKKLAIRDPLHWIPDFVDIEIPQGDVAPGKDTLVSIYVKLVGSAEERLRARLRERRIGDFVLGEIDIRVVAGDRDGRLRLPDGFSFTMKEQWSLSWIAYISGTA